MTDQVAAALQGFFWPKFFWDFATTNFDYGVKPIPILQTINLIFGILALAWEWPLKKFAGTALHRSIEARLVLFPLLSLAALLMYQSTNAGLYYLIGEFMYFWAYSEGEVSMIPHSSLRSDLIIPKVVCAKPWTLPKRKNFKKTDSPA